MRALATRWLPDYPVNTYLPRQPQRSLGAPRIRRYGQDFECVVARPQCRGVSLNCSSIGFSSPKASRGGHATVDYADEDFDALPARVTALIKSVFPDWTDFNVASFWNLLVEMFAFVGDVLTFYHPRQFRARIAPRHSHAAQERDGPREDARCAGWWSQPDWF